MRHLMIVAALVLGGCAAPSQRAEQPIAVVNTQPPKCSGTKCERMWLDAQSLLVNMTGMRLRMVTDSRIETFAPSTYGRMGATVVKYPTDDGGHELRVRFECYRHTDCRDLSASATNAFNLAFGPP